MHARILIAKSAIFARTQYCVGSIEPKGAAPPECSEGPLYGVFPVCGERPRSGAEWRPSSQISFYTTLPGSIMVAPGGHDPGEPPTPTRAFTTRPLINYPTRYNPKRPERYPGWKIQLDSYLGVFTKGVRWNGACDEGTGRGSGSVWHMAEPGAALIWEGKERGG